MPIAPILELSLFILTVFIFLFAIYSIRCFFVTTATPYNTRESVYWLKKYFTQPSKANARLTRCITNSYILNQQITPHYTLAFVGDIMPCGNAAIAFGKKLKTFLSGCDYLVGNFEGVLTESSKGSIFLVSDRRHDTRVISGLKNIFPPEKMYLSLANNHSGDFGKDAFLDTVDALKTHNFNVFGWNDTPYCDINDDIRIVSGTMWSNRKCDYVARLDEATHFIKPNSFNILYPHFGYEFELYPRPEIISLAKKLTRDFDALIGHHTHCINPVSVQAYGEINKLIAYSLGNFFGRFKRKSYQQGRIIKIEVGCGVNGWGLGRAEWRTTRCAPILKEDFLVEIID